MTGAPARSRSALVARLPRRPAAAQFFDFGQNKIQYRQFDWRVLRGEHVDLYYYPAEEELAPHGAGLRRGELRHPGAPVRPRGRSADPAHRLRLARRLRADQHPAVHAARGLLGVTDFLKRRVTLPFRGNFAEFRHTLRHELVHVFQLSLHGPRATTDAPGPAAVRFPLWWTEGLAELWSGGQDARDEMILRDLTLTGRLPPLQQLEYVTQLRRVSAGRAHPPLAGRHLRRLAGRA